MAEISAGKTPRPPSLPLQIFWGYGQVAELSIMLPRPIQSAGQGKKSEEHMPAGENPCHQDPQEARHLPPGPALSELKSDHCFALSLNLRPCRILFGLLDLPKLLHGFL